MSPQGHEDAGLRLDRLRLRAEAARARPTVDESGVLVTRTVETRSDRQPQPDSYLSTELLQVARDVGMSFASENRSASFAVIDQFDPLTEVQRHLGDQIELLPMIDAVQQYPEVAALSWSLLDPGQDRVTAEAFLSATGGFFLRVEAGARLQIPIQACLLLARAGSHQVVHNVIVVEDNAELSMITGCTAPIWVKQGLHVGVTEVVLGRGATFTDTMIHRWPPDTYVRSRTAVRAAAGATYVSNYVLLKPPRSLQAEATVLLDGDGSRAEVRSIVVGTGEAEIDVSTDLHLRGAETSAESVARAIARDRSEIVVRSRLVGHHDHSQGRLDCRGMLLSPDAQITSVPELCADHAPRSQLAHEAAIGPISEDAIEYVMSRGVPQEDAIATITRGFLKAGLPQLPAALEQQIHDLSTVSAVGSL